MTLIHDCPRCHGADPDCAVCLGDGHVMTGYGRQAYEIARRALDDAAHDRAHATRYIDHTGRGHTCRRCQHRRRDDA